MFIEEKKQALQGERAGRLEGREAVPAPVLLLRASVTHVTMVTRGGLAMLPLEAGTNDDPPALEQAACWEGAQKLGPLLAASWTVDPSGVPSASRVRSSVPLSSPSGGAPARSPLYRVYASIKVR